MAADEKSLDRLSYLYPELRVLGLSLLSSAESRFKGTVPGIKITQGFRSFNEQDRLFEQGRSVPGRRVTNAGGGQSFHNYGLAFDVCFLGPDPYLDGHKQGAVLWNELGTLGRSLGLEWGGDFSQPDRPHFQKSYGFKTTLLMEYAEENGLGAIWEKIDAIRKVPPGTHYDKIPALHTP